MTVELSSLCPSVSLALCQCSLVLRCAEVWGACGASEEEWPPLCTSILYNVAPRLLAKTNRQRSVEKDLKKDGRRGPNVAPLSPLCLQIFHTQLSTVSGFSSHPPPLPATGQNFPDSWIIDEVFAHPDVYCRARLCCRVVQNAKGGDERMDGERVEQSVFLDIRSISQRKLATEM